MRMCLCYAELIAFCMDTLEPLYLGQSMPVHAYQDMGDAEQLDLGVAIMAMHAHI